MGKANINTAEISRKGSGKTGDALPAGTILKERYLLKEPIGCGGFGITYLAMDLCLRIPVAVKELFISGICRRLSSGDVAVEEKDRECFRDNLLQFLSEARMLAMINEAGEPGVVSVKDHFEDHQTACIVMEYLKGLTLREWILSSRPDPYECLEIMEKVSRTMERLHGCGVFHRDISPENIMILSDFSIKLMDFGSALVFGTGENQIRSVKAGYTPAEQYREGGRTGAWTDVYSVAATACFCFTGKRPPRIMAGKNRRWIKENVGKLPDGRRLSRILERAMDPDASLRTQSMPELLRSFVREKKRLRMRLILSCLIPTASIPLLFLLCQI